MRKQQIIQVKFQRKRRSNIQFDKKQNQINYITMRMRVESESYGSTLISYVYLGVNYENVKNCQIHLISLDSTLDGIVTFAFGKYLGLCFLLLHIKILIYYACPLLHLSYFFLFIFKNKQNNP